MSNQKAKYYIQDIASILREFDGFDEKRYTSLVKKPPVPLWGGPLKFLRFFQWLIGDIGYMFNSFKIGNVHIDFYYHSDKSVDPIIVKGSRRNEGLFKHGTRSGDIAREIARDHHVAFCHTYTIYDDHYGDGPYKKVKDYAYVRKANPDNLKEKIENIREADGNLTKIIRNNLYLHKKHK